MKKQEFFVIKDLIPPGFIIIGVEVKVDKPQASAAPRVQAETSVFEGKVDLVQGHDEIWRGTVAAELGTVIRFSAISRVNLGGGLLLTIKGPGKPQSTTGTVTGRKCETGPFRYTVRSK